jgi:hypothetical protein
MPWINGRFYANPLFGRALERARAAESGRVWSEQYPELEQHSSVRAKSGNATSAPKPQRSQDTQQDHQKAIEKKASVGYAETRGLIPQKSASAKGRNHYDRSSWDGDSFDQLQEARRNIMDVSDRNPVVRRAKPGKGANTIDKSVWDDNKIAAADSIGALPGNHFFIRQAGVGLQRPPKKAGYGQSGDPVRSYGPFINAGGGDVPRGNRTYIDIYDR